MLDYLERERGIKGEILLEAVSNALLSASKKSVGASRELRIDINPKTGEIRALASLIVAEKVTNPQDEISINAARKIKPDTNVGDVVEEEVTTKNFGRIAAQTAKQAMMQRIGKVEIGGMASEAGDRTKIALWNANEKVDPVGACVGMRGSRVKNIVRELNNEKVDIIRWSSDPKEFILEALKPAKVKNLTFDTEKKSVTIAVDEDQLSLAIGKKGQNARLTSRLTGWEINIQKDTSATTAVEQKVAQAAQALRAALPISQEQATTLVKSGFTNLEGLRDADVQDLVDVLGIDEAKAREIHEAVKEPEPAQ